MFRDKKKPKKWMKVGTKNGAGTTNCVKIKKETQDSSVGRRRNPIRNKSKTGMKVKVKEEVKKEPREKRIITKSVRLANNLNILIHLYL